MQKRCVRALGLDSLERFDVEVSSLQKTKKCEPICEPCAIVEEESTRFRWGLLSVYPKWEVLWSPFSMRNSVPEVDTSMLDLPVYKDQRAGGNYEYHKVMGMFQTWTLDPMI